MNKQTNHPTHFHCFQIKKTILLFIAFLLCCGILPAHHIFHSSPDLSTCGFYNVENVATGSLGNSTPRITDKGPFLMTINKNGEYSSSMVNDIDLELTLTISPPDPNIYETTSLTLTLNNTGASNATGIAVSFPKPNGTVYEGGNEWAASDGIFSPFGNEEWVLANLPAGNSVTLTVNYFMLTALPTSVYAQVVAANETDADSTPDNGTPPSANEDDEANGSINGSTTDPCTGNLTINTQADLNNFPSSCTIWNGDLTIIGQNITDLSPLSNLQQVTGDFQVRENNVLTSLAGLENLTSTGGGCAFIHLEALTSITALSNLQSVGGRLQVSATNVLQSLDGLQNVTSAVQLWISDNQSLSECCSVFDLINDGGVVNNNIVIFLNPQFCEDENEILANCSSNQNVCPGDITLSSQTEVDAWPGCTIVEGTLRIQGSDITDLSPLATLQKVRGALFFQNNTSLVSIAGMENVDSVEALLFIDNPLLEGIGELGGLTQTGIASIVILRNHSLQSIGVFNNFTSADNIEILENDGLQSITGFSNLQIVDGKIHILEHANLTEVSGFQNLVEITDQILFLGNLSLANLSGFGELETVGAEMVIVDNNQLENLNNFSNLNSVGDFVLLRNESLQQINALSSLISVSGSLSIENNPALSNCCGIYPILNSGGIGGSINISGNPMTCSNEQEILDNCIPSGGVDLELDLTQPNADPAQWSNYEVVATINNAGDQPATGVKVSFKKPAGVVYVGGNEFTVSQGSFGAFGNEEWTVGTIPPGGSATLTVNYFLLNATSPMAYSQVIAANEPDVDSTPNNGTPPTVNEDDEASTDGGGPPNLTPDLTISDLQIANPAVQPGQVLNYTFDLANVGTGAVPGNFTVKSFISTDNMLSANDIQEGTITTGNYGAGLVVNDVPGASVIPANLANGSYYLLVKVDGDEVVTESNENNNIVARPFTVSDGGSGDCGILNSYGSLPNFVSGSSSSAVETGNGYEYILTGPAGQNMIRTVTLKTDFNGTQTDFTDTSAPNTQPTVRVTHDQSNLGVLNVEKKDANGNVVWTTTITLSPPEPAIGVTTGFQGLKINGGYFLSGTIVSQSTYRPFLIKIDEDGNELQQNYFPPEPDVTFASNPVESNDGGYYLTLFRSNFLQMVKVDGDGAFEWITFIASDLPSNNLRLIKPNLDGSAVYVSNTNNQQGSLRKFAASNGDLIYGKSFLNLFSNNDFFTNNQFVDDVIPTSNDEVVFGFRYSAPGEGDDGYRYGKLDAQGNVIWSKELTSEYTFDAKIQTSDGGFLFTGSKNGSNYALLKITALGQIIPLCDGTPANACNLTATVSNVNCNPNSAFITFSLLVEGSLPYGSDWMASLPVNGGNGVATYFGKVGEEKSFFIDPGNFSTLNLSVVDVLTNTCSADFDVTCGGGGSGIDLALEMTTTNVSPTIYTNVEITVTVSNSGPETATDIAIAFPKPDGTVYTGGNEWTATAGSFSAFGNEEWSIGSLPAGGSASLSVSYFLLTSNTLTPYAQVVAANETDSDSPPGNGSCCTPNEDDEAAIIINEFANNGGGNSLKQSNDNQRLFFNNIFPNPSKYWVTFEIFSKENQTAVLDFYNQQGQAIHRIEADLKEGRNEVELDVSHWRSGAYNVIGRGNGHPAYGRFLKVWED